MQSSPEVAPNLCDIARLHENNEPQKFGIIGVLADWTHASLFSKFKIGGKLRSLFCLKKTKTMIGNDVLINI